MNEDQEDHVSVGSITTENGDENCDKPATVPSEDNGTCQTDVYAAESESGKSEQLILQKIEKLNFENIELRTENTVYSNNITQLQKTCTELRTKYDRSLASVESTKRELQSMVIKYATSENQVIIWKKHYADSDRKYKEMVKERDALQSKIKDLTNEKKALLTNVERKILECATLSNENEILKNRLEQADVRIEQQQLSLTDLIAQHKEARYKLDRIENGLAQASQFVDDEDDQAQQFQLTEDDPTTEEQPEESIETTTPRSESENCDEKRNDWTEQFLRTTEQNRRFARELDEANSERAKLSQQVEQLDRKLTQAHEQMKDYTRKGELIDSLKDELISKQAAIDSLKEKFDQINNINRDLVSDIDACRHKEAELLEYTERLTGKLVSLQSEHNILREKLKCSEEQSQCLKDKCTATDSDCDKIKFEFETFRNAKELEIAKLQQDLDRKTSEAGDLCRRVDELENDIKIVKRKHIANLKELNKEIQALKKQQSRPQQQQNAEQTTSTVVRSKPAVNVIQNESNSPLSSRTSSFASLSDIAGSQPSPDSITNGKAESDNHLPVQRINNTASHSDNSTSSSSTELITSLNDIDKNALIDRILRLQRNLTKRNEKIDFLEEHNQQLTEEVKKKSRLLQYYILKEESGALATESMDKNKAYLSRRGGGIMSSLYNSSSTDESMTLERSLEICGKLHAVLEDTLLKNMTLKENLNTLASEVDRLSKLKTSK